MSSISAHMTCYWCGHTSDEVYVRFITRKPLCNTCNYLDAHISLRAKVLVVSKIIFINKDK